MSDDTGTPPVIPADLLPYDSYATDPKYARILTYTWVATVGVFALLYLPRLVRRIRNGRAWTGIFGVTEDWGYHSIPNHHAYPIPESHRSSISEFMDRIRAIFYWTLPGIELNLGQMLIVAAYFALATVLTTLNVPLTENSNRAGFVALASFPPLFLLGTKNSILTFILPGNGYEKLNFLHRWSARIMFLGITVHGSLWIKDHLTWGLPILGQFKETTGVAAFGIFCCIVLASWRTVRRARWEVFWVIHMLGFPAFFITVCYHTIYASPWIFPPLAFYGFDLIFRMIKFRVKDVILIPVDSQMTVIQIPHATSSFSAGQHVRLRVFFTAESKKTGTLFSKLAATIPSMHFIESHPLTIINAPRHITCITNPNDQGILLGARVTGDWTRALNGYAQGRAKYTAKQEELSSEKQSETSSVIEGSASSSGGGGSPPLIRAVATISGPYSATSIDLGQYENALLFAGGSGVTFTLSLLDDIVGRCVKLGRRGGERTRRIEFGWCIRSFGALRWFAGYMEQIASAAAASRTTSLTEDDEEVVPLDLHVSVYVTCLCNPEAIPPIPNCDVMIVKPDVYTVLTNLLTPPPSNGEQDEADESLPPPLHEKLPWVPLGGGVAVCASGPESMTREASNAVARLQMSSRARGLGRVGLCTELFAM